MWNPNWTERNTTDSHAGSANTCNVATALIFSADTPTSELLIQALRSVAIAAERCDEISGFTRFAGSRRYEVACIDFGSGIAAAKAIAELRSTASNRTAIVIAITLNSEESNRAFACGAHFVLQQPISRSSVDGVIRAAYGLIIRERRRYFRCPLDVTVAGRRGSEGTWHGRAANVSEGGLCIVAPVGLVPGDLLELGFQLPATTATISTAGEVQWSDIDGHAGLQFMRMTQECRSDLQRWLADRLDGMLKPTLSQLPLAQSEKETFLSKLC